MRAIVKLLMAIEAPDDLAARQRFRKIAATLEPQFPEDCEIRDFKIVEDGTGRLIDSRRDKA